MTFGRSIQEKCIDCDSFEENKMSVMVPTIASVTGLMGGYKIARVTGVRALGGVVLAAGGAVAYSGWKKNAGTSTALALTGVYLGSFGYSHVLAHKIGAWPSVCAVTGATAAASVVFGRQGR
ncbi:hypothetical protein [Rothia sp. P13129]|uniref:hypothetical protein n=1 Tax=unclassified Rothia (in: high G+C Gram-positive bacteria) TaxID=2689056 RepID=UPI003ABEE4E6